MRHQRKYLSFYAPTVKVAAFRRPKLFILGFAMFVEFQLRRNYYLTVVRIEHLSEEDNTLTLGNVCHVSE